MQVQGVISLVSLNHLNARRVAQCANGVYNPAFLYSSPASKCCNETITFQLRQKKKTEIPKETPSVEKPDQDLPKRAALGWWRWWRWGGSDGNPGGPRAGEEGSGFTVITLDLETVRKYTADGSSGPLSCKSATSPNCWEALMQL